MKTDLRVLRTKQFIKNAFYELLKEKTFDKISISDISTRAIINRNTFYLHYIDKQDLLDSLFLEAITLLHDHFDYRQQAKFTNVKEYLKPSLADFEQLNIGMLEIIKDNIQLYEVVFSQSNKLSFIRQIKEILKEQVQVTQELELKDQLYLEFMLAGALGLLEYFILHKDLDAQVVGKELAIINYRFFEIVLHDKRRSLYEYPNFWKEKML